MSLEDYIRRLHDDDPYERLNAFDALMVEADPRTAADVASRMLEDADAGVREQAARCLVAMESPAAADHTAPLIASEDIAVRNMAGEILVQLGTASIDALAPAIDHFDHDVRKFAIDVLAQLPAQVVAARIAARLSDPDDNVVLAAVDALGDLGAVEHRDALRELYHRMPLARPSVVAALGAFGVHDDLDLLETALRDEDPVVQYVAAEALSGQDAPEVPALLLRMIPHVDPMARPVMLHSLIVYYETYPEAGTLPASLREHVLAMLDDLDPSYQCAAVRGLRCFLDETTAAAVLEHAGQDDTLDVEIFNTLAGYPGIFAHVVQNVEAGRITPDVAAGFVLGFVARQVIAPDEYHAVSDFFATHAPALDAETKIAALGLCQTFGHVGLFGIVEAGLADPDQEVSGFAIDAARALGLDDTAAQASPFSRSRPRNPRVTGT